MKRAGLSDRKQLIRAVLTIILVLVNHIMLQMGRAKFNNGECIKRMCYRCTYSFALRELNSKTSGKSGTVHPLEVRSSKRGDKYRYIIYLRSVDEHCVFAGISSRFSMLLLDLMSGLCNECIQS